MSRTTHRAWLLSTLLLPACAISGGGDPDPVDTDGDGLFDDEESELGTDPESEDTDGDGHGDADELDAETNPLNPYLHPFLGGYELEEFEVTDLPEADEPDLEIRLDFFNRWMAYEPGEVPANFTLIDQYGERVDLYSFFGRQIMLAIGAEWCGPCNQAASVAQDEQDTFGPEGFQMLEIVIQDGQGNEADLATGERWANTHGLVTVPSLAAGAPALPEDSGWNEDSLSHDAYIPTFVHIGPDMRLLSVDQGIATPESWL